MASTDDRILTSGQLSPPPWSLARFVWAILPLALISAGLAIATVVSVFAYGAWHRQKAYASAETARARLNVGMTVGEVRAAVDGLGSLALDGQASAPSWGQIQVWSGAVGYGVIVRFDTSGNAVAIEAPQHLD